MALGSLRSGRTIWTRGGSFYGSELAAFAFANHDLGPGDPAGNGDADRTADRGQSQRDQNPGGDAKRRRGCRQDQVNPALDYQAFQQRRPDRQTAKPEQRAKPQRDDSWKQLVLRYRLALRLLAWLFGHQR